MGSMEAGDAEAAAVQKPGHPRVDLDSMKAKIAAVQYWRPKHTKHMTVCAIKLVNGFTVLGESAPADPANYSAKLGKQFSYEAALRKLWPLEGYLLSESLHRQASGA